MIDWFTGLLVGWTMNTSFSRTLSRIWTKMFSFANWKTLSGAGLDAEVAADLPGQVRVGVAVVDLELVRVHAASPPVDRTRRSSDSAAPGPPRTDGRRRPGPASGPPLSSLSRPSANPGRKAAMPTTRSPSFRRMTITPRACGGVAVDGVELGPDDLALGRDQDELLVELGDLLDRRHERRSCGPRARSGARPGRRGA